MTKYFAVIGSNGFRSVVWGAGLTEAAATEEAARWAAECPPGDEPELEIVEISKAQFRRIEWEDTRFLCWKCLQTGDGFCATHVRE